MSKQVLKAVVFICLVLSGMRVNANVIIGGGSGRVMIGKDIYVLQTANELTFADALKSAAFKKYDKDVPNLGLSAVSVWLKFTVTNQTKGTKLLLDVGYPILDEVEFFEADTNGQYHSLLMGEIKNFKDRKYAHPDYIFELDIPQNSTRTYYLRVKSAEQLILPISVNEPTALWQNLNKENVLSGLFIGAIIIMFLYNLFIFFSVRDKSYLYYVIYVASVGLTQIGIKGFTFQYLWPNSPAFELKSVIIFACLGAIAALLFTKIFLDTPQRARRFDKVLTGIIVLLAIALLLTVVGKIQIGFQLMQVST
ncbi:MAG: histidine kinase, partial [Mucilaginibacter sp.]|nr:histidine kinase [Mucilaginibacter sp.]